MTYASSHRKGVSRRVWLARQYYFQMLADAIETFPPAAEGVSPREHSAASLIYAIKLVGAAIEADEPKEQEDANETNTRQPRTGGGNEAVMEDTSPSRDISHGH